MINYFFFIKLKISEVYQKHCIYIYINLLIYIYIFIYIYDSQLIQAANNIGSDFLSGGDAGATLNFFVKNLFSIKD